MSSAEPDIATVLARKIRDPELLRLAAQDGSDRASVMIEVRSAPSEVAMRPARSGSIGAWELSAVLPPTPAQTAVEVANRDGVEQVLARLLGTSPVWISASNTFVAELTGGDLRKVATVPEVARIHPNRRRR